jgi:enoyl-CoA hydratase
MSGKILTEVESSVATLVFHNPERHNSLSLQMWQDAAAALDEFAAADDVRAIIVTGSGEKSFASGADISEFETARANAEGAATYDIALERFWTALGDNPKPTIAKIRGFCLGGGLNIAACCDLRVCGESSRFGVPAAKLGLGYGVSTMRRLVAIAGPQYALEMLLTARHFTSGEARDIGLVNHVVPDADVESYVRTMVEGIARNAPLTIRAAKRVIHELLEDASKQDLAGADALVKHCFDSEDYREGRRAFLEKRKPEFKGR